MLLKDVMTPGAEYLFEDRDTAEAPRLMQEKQIRRLVALSRDKKLVGIVPLGDLAADAGNGQAARPPTP